MRYSEESGSDELSGVAEFMEKMNRDDPDWTIKLKIAKSVAKQSQPSLMKFYQAYGEEFGTRPPQKLIDYFTSLLPKSSPKKITSEQDVKKAFVQNAIKKSLSVLKFREAYLRKFKEKPPVELVEMFIQGLGSSDAVETTERVDPALRLIEKLKAKPQMTILEFRQLFKLRLGKLPSAEHVQLFLDRMSKDRSSVSAPESAVVEEKPQQVETKKAPEKAEAPVKKTIFDGITRSAIITSDKSGNITLCNSGAEKLLEFSRLDLVNKKTILSLIDPNDLEVYYSQLSLEVTDATDGFDALVGKVDNGGSLTREWRFITKSGNRVSVDLTISRLPEDYAASKDGFFFELYDLTEQHETRRKIHEMVEQKEAQSLERENLLMAISRKVLDPVTSIKGFSELLREDVEPELYDYVDIISGNADTITRIITDYIVSHTIREGDFELETSPFSPGALLDEAIRYNKCWLGSRDIEFELLETEHEMPLFLGDRSAIQHILIATVGHAVELPGVHKIEVRVRYKEKGDARSQLIFDLATHGGTISAEELDSAFSSSENLLAGKNINYSIPVLSMAICKQLTRMMGGDIEITAVSEKQVFYRVSAIVGIEEQHSVTDARKMRILVAENDTAIYHLLDKILTEYGHKLTWVKSGEQVISSYLSSPEHFDLILMDVGMPEKGGVMATKEIRTAGHTKVPIVALTACNSPGDSERFLLAGMSGYIEKPFTKEILLNSLIKWQPD